MNTARLEKPMKVLTVSFLLEIVGFVILIFLLPNVASPAGIGDAFLLAGAGLAFYVSLGMLAARLGRSWIAWVGLTVITKPIGSVVAYFLMRQRVSDAIRRDAWGRIDIHGRYEGEE